MHVHSTIVKFEFDLFIIATTYLFFIFQFLCIVFDLLSMLFVCSVAVLVFVSICRLSHRLQWPRFPSHLYQFWN